MTITNLSPWAGWLVDASASYESRRFDFVRDFAIHADALVFEDFDGSYKALVWSTDTRPLTHAIDPTDLYVLTPSADARHRKSWQRHAQTAEVLDINISGSSYTISENTLISDIGSVTHAEVAGRTFDSFQVSIYC